MIRIFLGLSAVGLLAACSGDGQGSQYSSARAQVAAPVYIPVTPGATPVLAPGVDPATAVAVDASGLPVTNAAGVAPVAGSVAGPVPGPAGTNTLVQPAPAVLTEPIAVTPGAVPVTQADLAADQEQAVVTQASVITTPLPAATTRTQPAPAQSTQAQPAQTQQRAQVVRTAAPAAAVTGRTAGGRKYARGPIYSACRGAGRKEATDKRCGCVQHVANKELSPAQQKRGAGYFNNQQGVQDARQSDRAADERFWTAWKAFGQSAGRQCQST